MSPFRLRLLAVVGLPALCAVLVLAAAHSLDPVFREPTWLATAALPLVIGLGAAALVRLAGGHAVRPLLVGLLAAGATLLFQYWPETLVAGLLPGTTTWAAIGQDAGHLREVIRNEAIPVPAYDSALAGVGLLLAVTALLADALVSGLRTPALAGLPAVGLIAGGAILTGSATGLPSLVVAALAWLGLLAVASTPVLDLVGRRIGPEDTVPAGSPAARLGAGLQPGLPARSEAARRDLRRRRAAVGVRGLGTTVAAGAGVTVLVLASQQLPMLTTGLAPEGHRFITGQGGPVDPAADLGAQLRSEQGYVGISYRTVDDAGLYLRTAVVGDPLASPWSPVGTVEGPGLEDGEPYAEPPASVLAGADGDGGDDGGGQSAQVEAAPVEMTLEEYRSPWLPAPDQGYAVTEGIGGVDVQADARTGTLYRTDGGPNTLDYTVATLPLEQDLDALAERAGAEADPAVADDWATTADLSDTELGRIAREVAGSETNPVRQAVALQQYLRSERFSYSETAPVDFGYDGSGLELTEQFLDAGAGYCIHFTSAMVLMAQSLEIPARVVVGYAPVGTAEDGAHRVTSDVAHSWPELHFAGIGWVPFEPTPGVGRVPDYAQPQTQDTGDTEGARDPDAGPTPGAEPTAGADPTPQAPAPGPADASPGQDGAATPEDRAGLPWGLLGLSTGLVALLLVFALTPGWVRRRRRRRRIGAGDGGDGGQARAPAGPPVDEEAEDQAVLRSRVRAAWDEVEDTALDLRARRAEHETEPEFAARVGAGAPDAAERLAAAISWARYAPTVLEPVSPGAGVPLASGPPAAVIACTPADAATVVAAMERDAPEGTLRLARWLPRSVGPRRR